jgi:hypothetical protein
MAAARVPPREADHYRTGAGHDHRGPDRDALRHRPDHDRAQALQRHQTGRKHRESLPAQAGLDRLQERSLHPERVTEAGTDHEQ